MQNRGPALATIALLLMQPLRCAAQSGKVESIGSLTGNAVSQQVRQSLEAKGYRLTLDDPKPACELWLRKSVPSQANENAALGYPQFAESTLLGVMHFPQATADFRGHPIPAGFYTLRYELIPDDGNHLGVAPNRDFVLVIPAQSDPDPNAKFKFQELVTMSAKTAGTKHPSPLGLAPADKLSPGTVAKDDQDHWVFSASLKLASRQELPFAVIVKGTAQQ
ncbi:MAG TPA: hypothetical protein VEK33_12345 [Terriglobales bacterium]|nr:hypothetical protein [Terriglobales bacterium]